MAVVLMLVSPELFAQDTTQTEDDERPAKRTVVFVEAGLLAGGQPDKDQFTYKAGWAGYGGIDIVANKEVRYGIGAGYEDFKEEIMLPVFLEFRGYAKKDKDGMYIHGMLGYTFAWRKTADVAEEFIKYQGGIMVSPAIGYAIRPKNGLEVMISLAYRHQFMHTEINNNAGSVYHERLDYDFLSFRMGLAF